MTDRLAAALAELAAAIRAEVGTVDHGAPDRLLSIPEAAESLGIGRSALYGEIGAGRLRVIRIGRRVLIPSSAISERIGR